MKKKVIPVLRPTVDQRTKRELLKALDNGWWGQGPATLKLEEEFAKKVGAKYAIALNSGTAALDLCLKAYDIWGGELITTPMTFVSDAIVGEWNGMDVTFADVNPDTLCLDPASVVITPKTKAIITVDSHGRLADIKGLRKKFKGLIIEDCAHAMLTPGAGKQGDIAIWSFQAVKTVPAGDGGMITTNNKNIARKVKNMTWLGVEKSTYSRAQKGKYTWDYDITHGGTKSYMNDINAILVLGNMRRLDKLIAKRQRIQAKYNKELAGLPTVELPLFSYTVQYYTLKVSNRDQISEYLADAGIHTSVHFKPLTEMTYWKKAIKRPLPVTNSVWLRLLSLPCHDALTPADQNYIIQKFKEAVWLFNGSKVKTAEKVIK